MKKLFGYTLIELLVVVAIIGMTAVFVMPAFANYGKRLDFNQKVDELKLFFDQAYLLSKNPENSQIVQYEIGFNTDFAYLQSCNSANIDLNGLCKAGIGTQTVKKVSIDNSFNSFTCNSPTGCNINEARIVFPTDRAKQISSIPTGLAAIYFFDQNTAVGRRADFTFEGMSGDSRSFKINCKTAVI